MSKLFLPTEQLALVVFLVAGLVRLAESQAAYTLEVNEGAGAGIFIAEFQRKVRV